MLIVAVLPSILFPSKKAARRIAGQPDSSRAARESIPGPAATPSPPSAYPPNRLSAAEAETVWVTSPQYRLGFSTLGGRLVQAQLLEYKSFAPGDSGRPVQLVPPDRPLLGQWLVLGADTVSLADWSFTPSEREVRVAGDSAALILTAQRGAARVEVRYTFRLDDYRFGLRGHVTGLGPAGAVLVVSLGDGLRSVEADTVDDRRHYAVVTKATQTQSTSFGSVKPGEVKVLDGPFEWAGVKSKYFLLAALAVEEHQPRFGGGGVVGGLLLWPLNQKAMESGIRMQAVAPLIKETQDRFKNEPEKLQREMLRIYKEHQVNPFGGCLPMLLPMPVLFALFFVFANTIEFRGVAFLWLPDLSRPDLYYIIPIVMGLSMFVLSKVGQIGMPPNPQTKMMLYFMPAFLTLLFLNFASGLNLYYAVSNIFSIPQQYLIARRRLREQG